MADKPSESSESQSVRTEPDTDDTETAIVPETSIFLGNLQTERVDYYKVTDHEAEIVLQNDSAAAHLRRSTATKATVVEPDFSEFNAATVVAATRQEDVTVGIIVGDAETQIEEMLRWVGPLDSEDAPLLGDVSVFRDSLGEAVQMMRYGFENIELRLRDHRSAAQAPADAEEDVRALLTNVQMNLTLVRKRLHEGLERLSGEGWADDDPRSALLHGLANGNVDDLIEETGLGQTSLEMTAARDLFFFIVRHEFIAAYDGILEAKNKLVTSRSESPEGDSEHTELVNHWRTILTEIETNFDDAFANAGMTGIAFSKGQLYDPELHEIVDDPTSTGRSGDEIGKIVRPGLLYEGPLYPERKVIRTASALLKPAPA